MDSIGSLSNSCPIKQLATKEFQPPFPPLRTLHPTTLFVLVSGLSTIGVSIEGDDSTLVKRWSIERRREDLVDDVPTRARLNSRTNVNITTLEPQGAGSSDLKGQRLGPLRDHMLCVLDRSPRLCPELLAYYFVSTVKNQLLEDRTSNRGAHFTSKQSRKHNSKRRKEEN